MVADNKPAPATAMPRLVPCVECGHDRTYHRNGSPGKKWTDKEWEVEMASTADQGLCQWSDDMYKCPCTAFKHPNAPRRREAIEHSRRLGL